MSLARSGRRGARHGYCLLLDNHTTGAQARLAHNLGKIRPRITLLRTAKFGLFATIPAALALIMWLLIPGSLQNVDINTFFIASTVALVVLFLIGLVVAKLVLDYFQADDDQKIWQAAEDVSADVKAYLMQPRPATRR